MEIIAGVFLCVFLFWFGWATGQENASGRWKNGGE
jgi:hypothetical protein